MRITILTLGTHGDVRPFVALGLGLQRSGHAVRLAATDEHRAFVTEHGLEFASLGDLSADAEEARQRTSTALRRLVRLARIAGRFFLAGSPPAWSERPRWLDPLIEKSWKACQDAEVIISGVLSFWVSHFAEKLNVPCYVGLLQPLTPTRRFPSVFFTALFPSWVRLGGGFNRLSHRLMERIFYAFSLRLTNVPRQEILGLAPLADTHSVEKFYNEQAVILYGYSPLVCPKPVDWPEWHHVTGFWTLDDVSEWRPPQALVDFLSAGPAPVYVGFGSFSEQRPGRLTEIVLEALSLTGQRGVLLVGWGGLAGVDLPDTVFPIESAPHDWLFPRMVTVVHHGGAGTVGAALKAGVPSVSIPWRGDHPFFARCAFELGTSPRPIPKRRLTAKRLAAAIAKTIEDPRMRERAAAVAQEVRKEDGVARAVEILERGYLRRG